MSFWADGFWAEGFWAEGFWSEALGGVDRTYGLLHYWSGKRMTRMIRQHTPPGRQFNH